MKVDQFFLCVGKVCVCLCPFKLLSDTKVSLLRLVVASSLSLFISGLYAGLRSALLDVGVSWAVLFYFYALVKYKLTSGWLAIESVETL